VLFIHLNDCYHQLVPQLPNLIVRFQDGIDRARLPQLVLTPEDYLKRTNRPDRCVVFIGPVTAHDPVPIISHRLLSRIGGIHIDYTNRRIGFFDPI